MRVPAWETIAGGIRCLRLYEVSEIPCKSMAVFWHFFIVRVKTYWIIRSNMWDTTRCMEWNRNGAIPFFCSEEGNQADAKQTFGFSRVYIEKIYKLQSSGLGEAQGFSK